MTSSLSELTTLRLGGPATRIVDATSEDELVALVQAADAGDEPLLVLAGGSNVVVADEGFDGTVVRVATRGVEQLERSDGRVWLDVQAGENWDALVAMCVEHGLAGVEALSGIPGSVGATPIQNVGAYGQEVADVIAGVRALDRESGEIHMLDVEECLFDYRSSNFKRDPDRWVVLRVRFAFEPSDESEPIRYAELARRLGVDEGARAPLADVRAAVLELRRGKGMVLDPRRSRHGQRRLVLHEPGPARARVRRARRARGRTPRARRRPAVVADEPPPLRQDVCRLADRARGLSSADTATPTASRSRRSTRSP